MLKSKLHSKMFAIFENEWNFRLEGCVSVSVIVACSPLSYDVRAERFPKGPQNQNNAKTALVASKTFAS